MNNIKYNMTIDRIENNIAICELENREIIKIDIKYLPYGIKEGNIISYKQGKYFINTELEHEVKKRIKEKFKKLCK